MEAARLNRGEIAVVKLPIEIVDHRRDRRVAHNSFTDGADQRGSPAPVGAATDVVVAFGRICEADAWRRLFNPAAVGRKPGHPGRAARVGHRLLTAKAVTTETDRYNQIRMGTARGGPVVLRTISRGSSRTTSRASGLGSRTWSRSIPAAIRPCSRTG